MVNPLNKGENCTVDLEDCILLGKLNGVWGVKGWLKVFSYSRPRKNIAAYKQWLLVAPASLNKKKITDRKKVSAVSIAVKNCKEQGQNIVAQINGIDYRDQAEELLGYEVYIQKSQLKPLKQGEFYWSDMLDCEVSNLQGVVLGRVNSILETGANDVLVVRSPREVSTLNSEESQSNQEILEHLIPYSEEIVLSVDVQEKLITVDWGEDYLAQEPQQPPKKKLSKQERSEEIRRKKLADQQAGSKKET